MLQIKKKETKRGWYVVRVNVISGLLCYLFLSCKEGSRMGNTGCSAREGKTVAASIL
jgi:hypothetical protein